MTVKRVASEPVPAVVWHGNDRQARLVHLTRGLVVVHGPSMPAQHGDRVGAVDRAAAAKAENAIEVAGPEGVQPGLNGRDCRVWHGISKDRSRNPGTLQCCLEPINLAMAQKELVSDNEGTLESKALEHRPNLQGCPTTDPHDPRKRNARCCHARLP